MPKGWRSSSSTSSSTISAAATTTTNNKNDEKSEIDKGEEEEIFLGKRKALIISVSSYNHLQPLEFCKKDGEEMYLLLKNLGYEISTKDKIIGEVNREELRDTIINFFTNISVKSKDTLLFYYSGHGIPDDEGDDTYIATSDTDPNRPFINGYSFDELTRMMNRSISKRIVTILDCCCSGAAAISKGSEDEAAKLTAVSINKKSKVLRQGEGKCILAASLATQEAYGLKEKGHSIFTYHLLDGLLGAKGESIDNEGNVTPESLGNYIYDKVTESSIKQKPIIKTETSGKIILAIHPNLVKRQTDQNVGISSILYYAIQCFENEEYDNALNLLDEAIEINPSNILSYNYKGDIYLIQKKYQQAIDQYEKAISIKQDFANIWYKKGNALLELGNLNDALSSYSVSVQLSPNSAKYILSKGIALEKLDKNDEAHQCFDKVLDIEPTNEQALQRKYESNKANNDNKKSITGSELEQMSSSSQSSSFAQLSQQKESKSKDIVNDYYSFVKKWGSWGSSDGKFKDLPSITVDSSGYVYTVEFANNRIQKFDSNGIFIIRRGKSFLGSSKDGQFRRPSGIAVDSKDYVYVADSGNTRVQKFNSNLTYITQWIYDGSDQDHSTIAVDSKDYVYVLEEGAYNRTRVQKFDLNGEFITKWGSSGKADGQFRNPRGIAVDSKDYVYVADSGNTRIQKFDLNGEFVTKWGSSGTADGQFIFPADIAIDSKGYVYVSDEGKVRIQKFEPTIPE